MKLIMENWKLFVERQIDELIVHGEADEGTHVIAYGKDVWIVSDEESRERVEAIFKELDIETYHDFDKDDETVKFYDYADMLLDDENILVGDISDNKLYVLSTGSFTRDPKSSILIKKVVKELKLDGVVRQAGEEEDEVDYRDIKGKLPKSFFHGTSDKYLEKILRLGLRPGVSKTNYEKISHPELVFFTSRFEEALYHATHTAKKVQGQPIVLELKVPDENLIVPDYDIDVRAGNTFYDYIARDTRDASREHNTELKGNSMALSQEFGIYGYKGRIPGNHMTGLYVVKDPHNTKTDYLEISDMKELDGDEISAYRISLEEFGEGMWNYDPEEEEEELYELNRRDQIPGGIGDKYEVWDVNPEELELGIRVEMEHTNDREIAKEIALDHLAEDPKYYSKLGEFH